MEKWLKLDTNIPPIYAHSIDEFNSYVDKYKTEEQVILTKSKNISQETLRHMPASLVWQRGNTMEFHYIDSKQHIRVIYGLRYDNTNGEEVNNKLSWQAKNYFKGILDVIPTDDIEEDTELFTCEENPNSAYYNYVNERYTDMVVNTCYSLDRNNSFPASMAEVYPATRPWVEKYYQERQEMKRLNKLGLVTNTKYEEFKKYGSILVGWLNNPKTHRHRAWKKIVSNSNKVVHKLREYIESRGNTVLLVNTDAIKFIGYIPYEGSDKLGEFKYEWEDTKMYVKGVKSYAYLDKDKWKFKQAGKTKLDKLKPREDWTLDDFKNADTFEISHIIIKDGKLVEVFR